MARWRDCEEAALREARSRHSLENKEQPSGAWPQVVPTGPNVQGQSIRELALISIKAARKSLTLTTPYLRPTFGHDRPSLANARCSPIRRYWPERPWRQRLLEST
ncbi:MAG: hypothetical protein AAF328_04060 [Planctomycetota bacterium]